MREWPEEISSTFHVAPRKETGKSLEKPFFVRWELLALSLEERRQKFNMVQELTFLLSKLMQPLQSTLIMFSIKHGSGRTSIPIWKTLWWSLYKTPRSQQDRADKGAFAQALIQALLMFSKRPVHQVGWLAIQNKPLRFIPGNSHAEVMCHVSRTPTISPTWWCFCFPYEGADALKRSQCYPEAWSKKGGTLTTAALDFEGSVAPIYQWIFQVPVKGGR